SSAALATELVLDGALAPAGAARCDANVVLWDVTPGAEPALVHAERRATSPRNHRSFLPLDWLFKPGRGYRALCPGSALRASPAAPGTGPLAVNGAFSFALPNPCDGAALAAGPLASDQRFCELRYRSAALASGGPKAR